MPLDGDIDYIVLSRPDKKWSVSPMDKLYRLGQVYLEMFFIKNVINHKDDARMEVYGRSCEKYLIAAKQVGDEIRRVGKSGRNTWFISERLARYYIIDGQYEKAVRLIEHARDSYIKNTYGIALLLSDMPDRFSKAETALKSAVNDKYNLAKDISIVMLAYVYKLSGNDDKLRKLLAENNGNLNDYSNNLASFRNEAVR